MGVPRPPRSSLRAALAVAFLVAAVGGMIAVSAWSAPAPSASPQPRIVAASPAAGGLTVSVTFAGQAIGNASTESSAFRVGYGASVNVIYTWSQGLLAGTAWSINDARLQVFYFGFALGTRDILSTVGQTSGTLTMGNWSTGPLEYVLEGTFQLTASLIATNGTTAWSQTFWVYLAAPFYILAVLPIVLVIIAVYEVYALATCGKYAAIGKGGTSGGAGGGTTPATAAAPASSAPSAGTNDSPTAAPSDAGTAPPAGGSS